MIARIKCKKCPVVGLLAILIMIAANKKASLWEIYKMSSFKERNTEDDARQNRDARTNISTRDGERNVGYEQRDAVSRSDNGGRVEKAMDEKRCRYEDEVARILKDLIRDLIEMRVTLDDMTGKIIEEKYNKFQRLLKSIEKGATKSPAQRHNNEKNNELRYACPEKRILGKIDKSFLRSNCSRQALSETVTVIIDSRGLSNASQTYKLKNELQAHHKDVKVLIVWDREAYTRPRQINTLIKQIYTPFVYIARDVVTWNSYPDLERLIDVITSIEDSVAVGNAIKNITNGYWSNGCTQMKLRNYVLKYERGYRNSVQSCMKCSALDGPFLTRTEFIKNIKLRGGLTHGYYEDWFLRIQGYIGKDSSAKNEREIRGKNSRKSLGALYSCPDVTSDVIMTAFDISNMAQLADLWDIKKIFESNGKFHWYGCKRGMSKRMSKCRIGRGMSVPPCCLDNLSTAIKLVMRKCEEHDVACELMEGTLLGALKFNSLLPWERDADIAFYAGDFHKIVAMRGEIRKNGYDFKIKGKY